ncbi:Hsp20/alpha crystallin family protein [Dermatobacter hominis]|uniref:Hsp20/alpha crystallin family protein n=1 Tax=Dermatobacter hominis TaxID=2884263 RepID=UPI001D121A13|nr:Hsp20/alpha crystallin family protein [Dermatobacter hominis]UDY37553.1 Hsp20/alpha crystallin family protein [Dermatobacter hominis]
MLMRTDPFRQWDRLPDQSGAPMGAAMDAYRLGDVVTVQFDLPGVDPDSLDLQIERGELRLNARRRFAAPEGARYLIRERMDSTVTRRLMLGDVLDVDHVDAEYHDGVLTLRIPLSESAKPRRIDVRHPGQGDARAIAVESGQVHETAGG